MRIDGRDARKDYRAERAKVRRSGPSGLRRAELRVAPKLGSLHGSVRFAPRHRSSKLPPDRVSLPGRSPAEFQRNFSLFWECAICPTGVCDLPRGPRRIPAKFLSFLRFLQPKLGSLHGSVRFARVGNAQAPVGAFGAAFSRAFGAPQRAFSPTQETKRGRGIGVADARLARSRRAAVRGARTIMRARVRCCRLPSATATPPKFSDGIIGWAPRTTAARTGTTCDLSTWMRPSMPSRKAPPVGSRRLPPARVGGRVRAASPVRRTRCCARSTATARAACRS